MRSHKIAAIPGDGIGKEVIAAGLEVLEACAERDGGFALEVEHFDWGSDHYKRHGADDAGRTAASCSRHSTRSTSARSARPTCPTTSAVGAAPRDLPAASTSTPTCGPTRILPGITSPLRDVSGDELDWVIVRENSEGEYAGVGGRSHRGLPEEVGDRGVDLHPRRRRADHALRLRPRPLAAAQAAHRRHQVQRPAPRHGDVGRDRGRGRARIPGRDLGQDAGRRHDHAHGAQARRRSTPIVATNLHADILSDLAAALAGSLGIAPTANLEPGARASPRCSSRSTARRSTSWARGSPTPWRPSGPAAMMLEHLGETAAAARLMRAIERVTADPALHTPDLGGPATTRAGHRRSVRGAARRQSLEPKRGLRAHPCGRRSTPWRWISLRLDGWSPRLSRRL